MQGKTTFILKDKDTGKIVDEREEHNMVTNVLRDIFDFPRTVVFSSNNTSLMTSYLPVHKNLIRGLVLFGENIPERKDDYFMNERYNIVGTAGSAYTGTDPKRGTFNESASGVIENGYRLVWDFAPEKAIGTINCAGLSSIHSGNRGSSFSAGVTFASGLDVTNSVNGRLLVFAGSAQGSYAMSRGNDLHYYYQHNTTITSINIYKYRSPDPDAIHLNTSATIVLEESKTIPLPIKPSRVFANEKDGKIYIIDTNYSVNQKVGVKLAYVDVDTYEVKLLVEEPIGTPISYSNRSSTCAAFYNEKIYVIYNSDMYIIAMDGTLIEQRKLLVSSVSEMFLYDDKIWVHAKYSATQTPCYVVLEDEPVYLPNISSFESYRFHLNKNMHDPFIATSYGQNLYTIIRTDYLATINNLSEPIEKTDQHALQVRYELTE